MRLSFRIRIFRLLLLFAAVPAITLTIFGYYLATETPLPSDHASTDSVTRLSDYYSDLLYRDIEEAARHFLQDSELPPGAIDFLLVADDEQITTVLADSALSQEAVDLLLRTAREKERGLVAVGNLYFQFIRTPADHDRIVLAGLAHDTAYSTLLENLRQETAVRSATRELRPSYVAFLGGLFLSVSLLTIIAASFLSSRVSSSLAEPLTALSEASHRIAAGDFRQVVTASGEGEIQTLIESFNQMVSKLDQATTRLAQTERVAAWRQVARRFAHELKNPLQPILVSLYRIEKQLADSDTWDQVREPLLAATEEVKHLTALAERFSSLAKLPPPKLEQVGLNDLIKSVIDLYKEKLEEFGFELLLPETETHLRTDRAYVREALQNILQNAVDACADGDEIGLSVQVAEDRIDILVTDTGAGMDEETLSSARLPYFTTKDKGTGLGLAIVERYINELGGYMLVASRRGGGSTVTISLPRESS